MTTNDILDLLTENIESDNEDQEEFEITIEPPEESAFAQSDEDSDHSDTEATQDPNHPPRRMLRSKAILKGYNDDDVTQTGPPNTKNPRNNSALINMEKKVLDQIFHLDEKLDLKQISKISVNLKHKQSIQVPKHAMHVLWVEIKRNTGIGTIDPARWH